MPWQSAPGLMIIAGAFTLTGVGLKAVDNFTTGRVSDDAKFFVCVPAKNTLVIQLR